jgi:hypothetical protein
VQVLVAANRQIGEDKYLHFLRKKQIVTFPTQKNNIHHASSGVWSGLLPGPGHATTCA